MWGNSASTGNTTGMPHTLTFDTSTDGYNHDVDLNILAGPLTRLAPQIASGVAKGGTIVLSGLLRWQENLVLAFYRPHGLVFRGARRDGPWSALVLERP